MEWIDGNIGSKVTWKYPAVYLMGEHATGETLSVAFAGEGPAPGRRGEDGARGAATPSSRSQQVRGPRRRASVYRGLVRSAGRARSAASSFGATPLVVDDISPLDTYPYVDVREGRRHRWATGDGVEGQRQPALLPHAAGA